MPNLPDITKRHVRLLTFTGLAVGVAVCPAAGAAIAAGEIVAVGAAVATGIAGIVAGIMGSLVANELVAHDLSRTSVQVSHSQEKMANEDLIKASGLAVGWLIEAMAESGRYAKEAKKLKELALYAAQKWTMLISVSREGKFSELDPLQEEEINTIFAHQGKDFFEQTVLSLEDWQVILRNGLCLPSGISLEDQTISDLAITLHTKFAKALREVLKADFEEGGKAFAGLTLSILGEMLAILRAGSSAGDNSAVVQGINKIEALQRQLDQNNQDGFRKLGGRIDSGFEAVMMALGLQGEQIRDLHDWLRSELQNISSKIDKVQSMVEEGFGRNDQQFKAIREQQKEIQEQQKEIINTVTQFDKSIKVENFSSIRFDDMRPIVSDWQGRETELETVKDWLDNDEIQLAFITGIGGMGKTSLAVTVFNQSDGFQDKFWADLVIPSKFPSLARRILQQFWKLSSLDEVDQGLKNRGFSDSTLRNALIKTLQDQRFLLVLDNFESVVEDSEYIEFLLEWLDNCYKTEIIVTTQDMPPQIQSRLKDISVLPLQGLLTQAGVDFLRREINEPESELKILVEMVYGHPLTLKMLAAYLKDGKKIEDFKTELRQLDIASLMEHPKIKGRHRREEVQLAAVLNASFNRLAARLQQVLLSLLVVRGSFDAEMAREISGESVTEKELRGLEKRGFLIGEQKGGYTFQPFILGYLKYKIGDLTPAHRQSIKFYQSRYKIRTDWQTVADVQEYLEVFYHLCQLGEYPAAFDMIRNGAGINDVDDFLSLRGNNQIRVELYQQLITHLPDHQDWRYIASLTSLGNASQFLGRYNEAIDFHQQSLEIDREIGVIEGEAISLGNLGSVYKSLGRYDEAINFQRQSLVIKREIGDRQGEANSLCNLGSVYKSLGRYDEAINFYQQSLEIDREIGNMQGEANSLIGLGNAYNPLGRYDEAINFYQQSLEINREIGVIEGEAMSLCNLGNAYNSLGRYDEAINFLQQSLVIAQEIGNKQGEAASLNNLGNAYNSLGRYDEAINFYQQSLVIAREIGDRQGEANSLYNLGNAYQSLEEYETAISYYKQALEVLKPINHQEFIAKSLRGLSNTLIKLGNTFNSQENYSEAISYYKQALEIKQELEDKQGEASLFFTLGGLYQQVGRIKEGFAASQQAQAILQELDLPLDAYPYPNWMKKIAKFAQNSNLKFILCIILGIFAFPFALVGILLLTLFRLLRSRLPHP